MNVEEHESTINISQQQLNNNKEYINSRTHSNDFNKRYTQQQSRYGNNNNDNESNYIRYNNKHFKIKDIFNELYTPHINEMLPFLYEYMINQDKYDIFSIFPDFKNYLDKVLIKEVSYEFPDTKEVFKVYDEVIKMRLIGNNFFESYNPKNLHYLSMCLYTTNIVYPYLKKNDLCLKKEEVLEIIIKVFSLDKEKDMSIIENLFKIIEFAEDIINYEEAYLYLKRDQYKREINHYVHVPYATPEIINQIIHKELIDDVTEYHKIFPASYTPGKPVEICELISKDFNEYIKIREQLLNSSNNKASLKYKETKSVSQAF